MDPPGIDLRVHADCVSDENPQINPHDHEALADLEYLASGQDKLAPIAVIGFSLKFPQDATSPEGFWKILSEGRSAMTEVPSDHFNIDAFYSPDAGKNDCVRKQFKPFYLYSGNINSDSFETELRFDKH